MTTLDLSREPPSLYLDHEPVEAIDPGSNDNRPVVPPFEPVNYRALTAAMRAGVSGDPEARIPRG